MVDYLGQVINTGDLIVWPNRQGSSMWMNRGYVTWTDEGFLRVLRQPNAGDIEREAHVRITEVSRVVVVNRNSH